MARLLNRLLKEDAIRWVGYYLETDMGLLKELTDQGLGVDIYDAQTGQFIVGALRRKNLHPFQPGGHLENYGVSLLLEIALDEERNKGC